MNNIVTFGFTSIILLNIIIALFVKRALKELSNQNVVKSLHWQRLTWEMDQRGESPIDVYKWTKPLLSDWDTPPEQIIEHQDNLIVTLGDFNIERSFNENFLLFLMFNQIDVVESVNIGSYELKKDPNLNFGNEFWLVNIKDEPYYNEMDILYEETVVRLKDGTKIIINFLDSEDKKS